MEYKQFGRTDLSVSRLTFGCGAVGGLMTLGEAADQDRAVAWARESGINFFDTAPSYGNTASETNLGRALGKNRDGIVIGTKFRVDKADVSDLAGAVRSSLEASLTRLQQEQVDIFQLHNTIGGSGNDVLTAEMVLNEVIPAFDKMRAAGKTRYLGFTAKGDTDSLHQLVQSNTFDSAQIFYNLLVPSAGEPTTTTSQAQDYQQLLQKAEQHGVGSIGVRVLAGGALSGREARHALGMKVVAPIGSETDYATDVKQALCFEPLIADGHAASLPELAIRYVISNPSLVTTEIGIATLEEFQQATAAVKLGPLPTETLTAVKAIQTSLTTAGSH